MLYGRIAAGLILLVTFFVGCKSQPAKEKTKSSDSLAIREQYAESPVLDAPSSLKQIQLEKGFKVELVAAEPQVIAPVALTFDEKGRMWVVEMTGYMPDTTGKGEDALDGKIVILEDNNNDGLVDKRTVVIDSLVLPRGVCLIENGILVAEPPKLWFYELKDDKPVKKTLVDDKYAEGGNVEHQPNGLYRAMDNWIYNAKSDKRYRKDGDKWKIEPTHFRGQWGISQDDFGRLFYNNNSENLIGDFFAPGLGAGNPNQQRISGYKENIVRDNRVYPARATTGVNRGYMKGVLDDSLRLTNFTAACGPLIYRGALFGNDYAGNAFVAEPSANLIKRNILKDSIYRINGKQAYKNKEFLASTDERFRPVNLFIGLDGAMYVLDMYRGIIQHKTYLTPYLKNEIKMRELTDPLNCGRIYKVVPENSKAKMSTLGTAPGELLAYLDNPNGAIRDKAQQLIIDRHYTELAPQLKAKLNETNKEISLVHALWTLEGLKQLTFADLAPLIAQKNERIRQQAMAAVPSIINASNHAEIVSSLKPLVSDSIAAPVVGYLLSSLRKFNASAANDIQEQLLSSYSNNNYVADAVISISKDKEDDLLKMFTARKLDTNYTLYKKLQKVRKDKLSKQFAKANEALAKTYPLGAKLFKTICQTCHGQDGAGVQALAPPLKGSEWVTGDKDKLAAIILYGLTGPVDVAGKTYKSPEINGDMPGIGSNDEFGDQDIAQLMSFIRNAFGNKGTIVTDKDVDKIRKQYRDRQKPFTAEELKKR